MKEEQITSREIVLKNIRKALLQDVPPSKLQVTDFDKQIFKQSEHTELSLEFAEKFIQNNGHFVYCESKNDFFVQFNNIQKFKKWKKITTLEHALLYYLKKTSSNFDYGIEFLEDAEVGVTTCEALVSQTGSVVLSSAQTHSRKIHVWPPVHIVLAFSNQLIKDLYQTYIHLKKKYEQNWPSVVSVISGPARTADIEQTTVMGAHGPKEMFVFMIDEQAN